MEYCPYDLFKFVAIGDLALDESLCLFKQLCRGVEYIHNLGIAHRDLKLENVLLSEEGIVKLIDFGCATVFKAPFQKQPNKVLGIYGSDPYIAPEVFNKTVPYNAEASDNWSIGIIYLCMFMLKFPWKIADASLDKNYATFIKNWPHGRDRLFNQLPTKLDDDARPWVTGLVDLDPENRPHLKDMMEANWLKNIDICVPGKKATSHTHSFLNK
ncbi:Nitrogen permease reactivator protein [Zancudomyces culisetae]|nr:Nitrogen permease reactivator protein [Zancudomyces culisetae]|eukprot:OMH85031.1 Nitrogen permease reactivator protein [Zancudomyces culisetae]